MTRREARERARASVIAQKMALVVRAHRIMRQMEQAVPRLDHEVRAQQACPWVEARVAEWGSWAQVISRDVTRWTGSRETGARHRAADAREALRRWLYVLGTHEPKVKVSWARTLPEEVQAVYGQRRAWWAKSKTARLYPLAPDAYKAWENRVWNAHYQRQQRLKKQTTALAPWA